MPRRDECAEGSRFEAGAVSALQRKPRELQDKAGKLADAIEAAGHSPTLLARLAAVEAEIGRVDERIKSQKPVDLKATTEQMRDLATKNILNLQGLLGGDVTCARMALFKHVKQLVLTPRERPSGPVFEVSGAFDLLGSKDVLVVVKPQTVVGWHRAGFRLFWSWRSRPRGGRPKSTAAIRALIRRLAQENPSWGAPKIHGELQKLGFVAARDATQLFAVGLLFID